MRRLQWQLLMLMLLLLMLLLLLLCSCISAGLTQGLWCFLCSCNQSSRLHAFIVFAAHSSAATQQPQPGTLCACVTQQDVHTRT
jgi:hypothetical protein